MSAAARTRRADLARMRAVLAQEQQALKRADMVALGRLAPRKTALLARLEEGQDAVTAADAALVRQVKDDAARNARLLEAALRGVADARALLARFNAPDRDRTYASDGARHAVSAPRNTLERRA